MIPYQTLRFDSCNRLRYIMYKNVYKMYTRTFILFQLYIITISDIKSTANNTTYNLQKIYFNLIASFIHTFFIWNLMNWHCNIIPDRVAQKTSYKSVNHLRFFVSFFRCRMYIIPPNIKRCYISVNDIIRFRHIIETG